MGSKKMTTFQYMYAVFCGVNSPETDIINAYKKIKTNKSKFSAKHFLAATTWF